MKNVTTVSVSLLIIIAVSFLIFNMVWFKILFARTFKINSPSFVEEQYKGSKYRLSKPDYYNNTSNLKIKFPLVIFLHGGGKQGNDNRMPSYGLRFLGNGFNKQAKSYQTQYPSFVYVPQCPKGTSWNNKDTLTMVANTIEQLKTTYPIDENRLYLIGYSMGGSGTYSLASHYYTFNKQLFAGIIRLAGQGSFDKRVHEIVAKSSIWLHIGMKDTDLRIKKAKEAYEKLKTILTDSTETTGEINIANHPGTTLTLTLDNRERVKKSTYQNDGHGIAGFPFEEPKLLEWLFKQKLSQDASF